MIGRFFSEAARKRRRGAVAAVAVASMIPITTMFAASFNGGQMIEDRRTVQDAADALAMMHGTWSARSLNVLTMNNVTTTQAVTLALGSEALNGTLIELDGTALVVLGYIAGHLAIDCLIYSIDPVSLAWNAGCSLNHAAAGVKAGEALIETARIRRRFNPRQGMRTAQKAMDAIEGMNQALVTRFPRSIAEMGLQYAKDHGIDDFHFADPCEGQGPANCASNNSRDGMALPIDPIPMFNFTPSNLTARAEYCVAMQFGTIGPNLRYTTFAQRGFPNGSGPLTYGGSTGNPQLMQHIHDTTRIGPALNDFKRHYDRRDIAIPFVQLQAPYLDNIGGPGLLSLTQAYTRHPRALNLFLAQGRTGNNAFTRRYNTKLASFCTGAQAQAIPLLSDIASVLGGLLPGLSPLLEADVPTLWKLRNVPSLDLTEIVSLSPSGVVKVTPESMPDDFHVLAITQKNKGTRLASTALNDNIDSHYGYAQVGVFNPQSPDLFSQSWQYQMMTSSRMDDPRDVASGLRRKARSAFDDLATALEGVSDRSSWRDINAH